MERASCLLWRPSEREPVTRKGRGPARSTAWAGWGPFHDPHETGGAGPRRPSSWPRRARGGAGILLSGAGPGSASSPSAPEEDGCRCHVVQASGPSPFWDRGGSGIMAPNTERTFIAVKPDGVQRGLVGEIIKRFEQKGFRMVAMKLLHASEELLKEHYIDLKDKPFYPGLVKYMNSGPIVAMVWEGLNVVKTGRLMLGETNPADSKPGTIRGDFCIQVGRNIIHGSDSVESAQKEINLWFKPAELVDFKSCAHDWIYE
nr:PREDICTED: nucleoside diphosphate kinase isoform X1 [Anolis carolinensis]|eukprot:XP_003217334.3 PREDICTED: nucleoside diphosphate kinase isoform X1 [Anolis carolinensis]